jgi:Fe-S cluster assembly protein SufD
MGSRMMTVHQHNIVIEEGIHTNEPHTIHTDADRHPVHALNIHLKKQAKAQVIVHQEAASKTCELKTTVTLEEGAVLDVVVIQNDSGISERVDDVHISLASHTRFNGVWLVSPGQTSKRSILVNFDGEHIEANLNGLAFVNGTASVSTKTKLVHHQPNTDAKQFFKTLLNGAGQSEFNGLVYVKPEAQQTNSNQYNHNMILSDQARALSMPQLEIFADDVKCSHGATVGQLDNDHLFYLSTRGISTHDAKRILLEGFAEEIIDTIPIASCRKHAEQGLQAQLEHFV